jgi:hypothetical protein
MTFFSAFTLSFGLMLALMATIAAWLFRTSGAPLSLKLALPAALTILACATPFAVNSMMGFPVTVPFAALPDHAELIAFVPHDDAGAVDLWLRDGDVPRVYETALDEALKKTLREARDRMAHGKPAMLAKRGKLKGGDPGSHPSGLGGVGDDQRAYMLDDSAFNLPSKD